MAGFHLTLKMHRRLTIEEPSDVPELAPELGKRLKEAFSRGSGFGLEIAMAKSTRDMAVGLTNPVSEFEREREAI
jgi:hypothetical protein